MGRLETINNAYSVLGLEEGCSLEKVKLTYKKLALKTHPDKNPGNPEATAKFQELGAAYNVIEKHINNPNDFEDSGVSFYPYDNSPYEFQFHYFGSDDDDDDDEPQNLDFFLFVFEDILRGRENSRARPRSKPRAKTPETEEQYQARMRRAREEQQGAKERRAMEAQRMRERRKEERERERLKAEQRQKQKASEKKSQAEALKKSAEEKIKTQLQRSQILRSSIFAAARRGDIKAVQKGVWEDAVDAAGGELKKGGESFVESKPEDPTETLLHIAASRGELDHVEWLIDHSAEIDERNSSGYTAFHVALRKGHVPIVKHFVENYPPSEMEYRNIYSPPPSTSLLWLSVESFIPELVWITLENKMADKKDLQNCWSWICSEEGSKKVVQLSGGNSKGYEILEEIRNLLMVYGKFPMPSELQASSRETNSRGDFTSRKTSRPSPRVNIPPQAQTPTPRSSPAPSDESVRSPSNSIVDERSAFRGRGRGRGKPLHRGRGRGGMQRTAPVSRSNSA